MGGLARPAFLTLQGVCRGEKSWEHKRKTLYTDTVTSFHMLASAGILRRKGYDRTKRTKILVQ